MELMRLWDRVISSMQERIGHQDVEIWLRRPVRPVALDGQILKLQVDNGYYADWIKDNYLEALQTEASKTLELPVEISFTWDGAPSDDDEPSPVRPPAARAIGLNTHQTFSNFVIGECNKFAHAAAEAVADRPAKSYNPLFIYGATGLGKTHLMHAIGNACLRRHGGQKIVYVTAEAFMNDRRVSVWVPLSRSARVGGSPWVMIDGRSD